MSGTQDSIGIAGDSNADYSGFEKPTVEQYTRENFLSPGSPISSTQRKTSKSDTYPWTADTALNADKVKRSGDAPID